MCHKRCLNTGDDSFMILLSTHAHNQYLIINVAEKTLLEKTSL